MSEVLEETHSQEEPERQPPQAGSFWRPWRPRTRLRTVAAGEGGLRFSRRTCRRIHAQSGEQAAKLETPEQQALALPVADTPSHFCRERVGLELDSWQAKFLDSDGRRKVLLGSRQCGKSTAVAALAVHRMMWRADTSVVIVAPSKRQSALLVEKCRWILRKLGFQKLPGDGTNAHSIRLPNGSTVVGLPCSAPTIRGFTADLLIMDEAGWIPDIVYTASRPMLAATKGELVIMSSANEPKGFFWELMTCERLDWLQLIVRASEVERLDPEFLSAERYALGEDAYAREYECEFGDSAEGLFARRLVECMLTDIVSPLIFEKVL